MKAEQVRCRREYVLPGFVSGVRTDEVVRVMRPVAVGSDAAGWVLVRGEDGRRFVTHVGRLRQGLQPNSPSSEPYRLS